jgi:hypothetical protein
MKLTLLAAALASVIPALAQNDTQAYLQTVLGALTYVRALLTRISHDAKY